MEIKLQRIKKTPKSTLGELYIDNSLLCHTLEDVDRGLKQSNILSEIQSVKVQDQTAIPSGRYEVIIDQSTRFKKLMPHILDVPGFEGIRIHSGNTDADTDGCVLLGDLTDNDDFISNSRDRVAEFMPKLEEGLKQGKVFITII